MINTSPSPRVPVKEISLQTLHRLLTYRKTAAHQKSTIFFTRSIPITMSSSSTTTTRALLSLAPEMLNQILFENNLEISDFKNLRLICQRLNAIAGQAISRRIFKRIRLSFLRADLDSLIAISNHKFLASCVEEVEFQEFRWEGRVFEEVLSPIWPHNSPPTSKRRECITVDGHTVRHLVDGGRDLMLDTVDIMTFHNRLEEAIGQLFWVPPNCQTSRYRKTIGSHLDVLQNALDMFYNLKLFISRPMSSDRTIHDGDYKLTTGSLTNLHHTRDNHVAGPQNIGLFEILLPLMCKPESRVRKLLWADEQLGLSYVQHTPKGSFSKLESVELRLTAPSIPDTATRLKYFDAVFSHLCPSLAEALPTLTSFELWLGNCLQNSLDAELLESSILKEVSAQGCHLKKLKLVRTEADIFGDEGILKSDWLVAVTANALWLREVYFEGVAVTIGDIWKLKGTLTNLRSLVIVLPKTSKGELFGGQSRDLLVKWLSGMADASEEIQLESAFLARSGGSLEGSETRICTSVLGEVVGEQDETDSDFRLDEESDGASVPSDDGNMDIN